MFGIRAADRTVGAEPPALHPLELAVMGEGPGPAPQLALEGVGVLQRNAAAIGAADVADDDARLDRGVADEARHLGLGGGARVVEGAAALVLVEGDAPAIGMRAGLAT